ncbi:MAG: flagellar motor switch protein FliG [Deltaproteobacteria bacterium]|nr:flagellar motor switch protein FliG [Deltaproteobacteria bacterium]
MAVNNIEKASILLLSLDEDMAAQVMKNLKPEEIRRLGTCMNRLQKITSEDIKSVAKEFCSMASDSGARILSVGDENIKKIITKALGDEKAKEVLQIIAEESFRPYNSPVIEKLRTIDPKVLLDFTKMEHPQTIALLLVHLRAEQAADMLESFPPEKQAEVVRRIATLKSVPHEFIEEMTNALETELIAGSASEQHFGGVSVMAEILNRMSRSSEGIILEKLEEGSPDLVAEIRNLMFTFDDIFKLDDKSIMELIKEVDSRELIRALKVVDQKMREKIFRNMSERAAQMLQDDIEVLPPVRLSEVEKSQRLIIDIAKRLEMEGRIVIARSDQGDEFV